MPFSWLIDRDVREESVWAEESVLHGLDLKRIELKFSMENHVVTPSMRSNSAIRSLLASRHDVIKSWSPWPPANEDQVVDYQTNDR